MCRPATLLFTALLALGATAALTGCGLQVASPDLFLLERSGAGRTLTLLVNDGGTIRCNGGRAKQLSDPLLIRARDLASELENDAKAKLRLPTNARTVFSYSVRLQDGSISFPDTAAAGHHELALTEQFALEAARDPCGLRG